MNNNKIVIGLVGQIASGKGETASYLKDKYKISLLRFSSVLRKLLKDLNMEISRENQQNLSTSLRKNFGEDILSKYIAHKIIKSNKNIFAIDGVRRKEDIKHLKKSNKFFLVKITAEPKIRYQRLVRRGENHGDSSKSYNKFLADQKREADADIPLIMKMADYEIKNNKGKEELHGQIDNLINKLTKGVFFGKKN